MASKDQVVTNFELNSALSALAAEELLAGAEITLLGAAFGLPALVGAVFFGSLAVTTAFVPEGMVDELNEFNNLNDAAPFFSLPTLLSLPVSSYLSPKNDPYLAAKVFGSVYEISEIPSDLRGLAGSVLSGVASYNELLKNTQSLGSYWQTRNRPNMSNQSSTKEGGLHEPSLRPFSGKEPSGTETKDTDGTENSTISGDHLLEKLDKQFNLQPGDRSEPDRDLIRGDEKSNRNAPKSPEMLRRTEVTQPPGRGQNSSGHDSGRFEFKPGKESYAGGGEGDNRGLGHIA